MDSPTTAPPPAKASEVAKQQRVNAQRQGPAPFPVLDPEQHLANQILVALAGGLSNGNRTAFPFSKDTEDRMIEQARRLAEKAFTV